MDKNQSLVITESTIIHVKDYSTIYKTLDKYDIRGIRNYMYLIKNLDNEQKLSEEDIERLKKLLNTLEELQEKGVDLNKLSNLIILIKTDFDKYGSVKNYSNYLNKLEEFSNYTYEQYELIDSIENLFANKKYGSFEKEVKKKIQEIKDIFEGKVLEGGSRRKQQNKKIKVRRLKKY